MSNEMNESANITMLTGAVTELSNEVRKLTIRIQEMDERQRTIMVGWNAFLKHAEGQVRHLFRGNIPAPILKKLLQTAFKGIDDSDRQGR